MRIGGSVLYKFLNGHKIIRCKNTLADHGQKARIPAIPYAFKAEQDTAIIPRQGQIYKHQRKKN
jgi:hypothetical protein